MKPKRIWFMVAHRGGAKIFAREGTDAVQHVLDLDHPRGRMKSGEINADAWGRGKERFGSGSSSMEKRNDPAAHEAEVFAHAVAEVLNGAAEERRYDALVLIAEPRFLGLIRPSLSNEVKTRLVREEAKDLAAEQEPAIERALTAMAV